VKIKLCNRQVNCSVVRSKATRYASLRFLNEKELVLRLPIPIPLKIFLKQNKGWMERTYLRFINKKKVLLDDRIMINGSYFSLIKNFNNENKVKMQENALLVSAGSETSCNKLLHDFMSELTKRFLEKKSLELKMHNVSNLIIKSSKRRWGWCNGRTLCFNPFLASLPERLKEFVFYHELSHVYHLNHSAGFKKKLSEFLPDWRELNREMREYSLY